MPNGNDPKKPSLIILNTYLHPEINLHDMDFSNHKLLSDAEISRMKILFPDEGRFGKKDFPQHKLKYSFHHFGDQYFLEYKKIGTGKSKTALRLIQNVNSKKMMVVKKATYNEDEVKVELECLARLNQAIKANNKVIYFVRKNDKEKCYGVMMKLARGYNLSELMPLPFVRLIKLFHDLIIQLEKIHKKGIIHADIKELNIMYDIFRSKVTIVDFDLAILTDDDDWVDEWERGTEGYKAPEVFDNQFCFKTDYYSLGVVFYNLTLPCCKGKRKDELMNFICGMINGDAELRPSYKDAKNFFASILTSLGDEERKINVGLLDMDEYLKCKKNTSLYGGLISELKKYHEIWIVDERARKKIKYISVQRELLAHNILVNYDVFIGLLKNELEDEMPIFMHDKQGDIRYQFSPIQHIGHGIGDEIQAGLRMNEFAGRFFSSGTVLLKEFDDERTNLLTKGL